MKKQLLTKILATFLSFLILFSDITAFAASDAVVEPSQVETETETNTIVQEDSEDENLQETIQEDEEILEEVVSEEFIEESILEEVESEPEIEEPEIMVEVNEQITEEVSEVLELNSSLAGEEETLQTGYFSKEDQKYYADSNGILQSGWIKLGDFWRYFDKEQGSMEIPSETADGYWYKLFDGRISYFDKKATLVQNCWKTISNQKYYFGDEGFVVKGWHQDGSYWYYANEDGQMQKNVITLGEGEETKNYFFDANYRLSSGWKKLNGIYRYFNYDENHDVEREMNKLKKMIESKV